MILIEFYTLRTVQNLDPEVLNILQQPRIRYFYSDWLSFNTPGKHDNIA